MDKGVTPSGSGCQPTASAADASSRSGIPSARLAHKVEAAQEASRDLDAEIWAFIHSGYIEINSLGFPVVWHEDKGWVKHPVSLGDGIWRERKLLGAAQNAPRYTSSIDAAMTLVPAGMVLRQYRVSRFVPHSCEVAVDYAHGGWVGNSDYSFALALCSAALQARGQTTAAQGIEAATADETQRGSAVGESPVGVADLPNSTPEIPQVQP